MTGLTRRIALQAIGGAVASGALRDDGLATPSAKATVRSPLILKRGVNTWPWFSLTREYPAPRTDYAWPPFQMQRPVPTRADLARLRDVGFDFLRIPVDPGPYLAADVSSRNRLLEELMAGVSLAREVGLSVVVNLHPNGATHYWSPERMTASPEAAEFLAYLSFSTELASRIGAINDPAVAFEPNNEPGGGCASVEMVRVRTALLAQARKAAPDTTLVASGGCGSLLQGLADFDPKSLADAAPLLFTFHFYEPYLFTHQGAPWMQEIVYPALNNVPWPASQGSLDRTLASVRARMAADTVRSEAEKKAAYAETERVLKVYFNAQPGPAFIHQYLDVAARWAATHRIAPGHLLMGEFGALRSDARYVAAPRADRVRYIHDVRVAAEERGFAWAFWNLFDGMGLMDETTRTLDRDVITALGLQHS